MSWVKDNLLGGAAKEAAKRQTDALEQSQDITRQAVQEARGDIMNLFPQAQESQQAGYQSAINLLSGQLPQQSQLMLGGNQAAQNTILAGLPQMQNAILGAPVDYSQFQSYTPQVDFSGLQGLQTNFTQQQAAQPSQPVDPVQPQPGFGNNPYMGVPNFNQFLLSGGVGGGNARSMMPRDNSRQFLGFGRF